MTKGYISKAVFEPHSYEQLVVDRAFPEAPPPERYEAAVERYRTEKSVDVSRITYESDGLNVTGVEVLPKLKLGEKVPLIIYNRGGNREFGKLTVGLINFFLTPLAKHMRAGILASNYRGNDGGEGKEEFGGADIHDVEELIRIGQSQPWWDGKNIFMVGGSRGGMMTYLAIKNGAPLNAAATIAGESDLFSGALERPRFEDAVYVPLIPGWPESREAALTERSAVCWPEKLDVPLLLLHGSDDWRVKVTHGRDLYNKMQAEGKEVKYVEYEGDDHGLTNNRDASMKEIVSWFKRHLRAQEIDKT